MGYLWRLMSRRDGPSDLLELLTGLGGGLLLPTGEVPRSHAGSAENGGGYWRRVLASCAAVTRVAGGYSYKRRDVFENDLVMIFPTHKHASSRTTQDPTAAGCLITTS